MKNQGNEGKIASAKGNNNKAVASGLFGLVYKWQQHVQYKSLHESKTQASQKKRMSLAQLLGKKTVLLSVDCHAEVATSVSDMNTYETKPI